MSLFQKHIVVTGGSGFLGKHVCRLLSKPDISLYAGDSKWCLANTGNELVELLLEIPAESTTVIHLAGYNGGIKFNKQFPNEIYNKNSQMALNVVKACVFFGVKKLISVVASCAYPGDMTEMYEKDFLDGPPHESVACHGYAKRNLFLASKFAAQQHGLNAVCLCPTTLYGPGDSLDDERSKVMGGLIKRFLQAKHDKAETIECWGTGEPKREFMYVEDAANLIVRAMDEYNDSNEVLNLGTGQELSIRSLANIVKDVVGYEGEIVWNGVNDGAPGKRLNLSKMKEVLPFFSPTNLIHGIKHTVEDYKKRMFGIS